MTGQEIRQKIDENNRLIERETRPAVFVLNNRVRNALEDNANLRAICKHEFENGKCKFCDAEGTE